jgi:hypothetical protein
MNRVAISAACVAIVVSLLEVTKYTRRALGAIALEQIERVFDVIERVLQLAKPRGATERN